MPLHIVVAPRDLDRAFERLGAGIGEEHLVGETCRDKPLGKPRLGRDLVEIGNVPELAGLLGQRRDKMRMAVAERIDGDAAGEIQIALAVIRHQPGALAPFEGQGRAGECLVKRRTAHYMCLRMPDRRAGERPAACICPARRPKIKKAAQAAADRAILSFSPMKSTKTSRQAAPPAVQSVVLEGPASWGKLQKPIRVAFRNSVTESVDSVV